MGLDMYAYVGTEGQCELAYWRKHPNLHGWMEKLWESKGKPNVCGGGTMVVVTEIKTWGIQGYVQSAGVDGQQYIRLPYSDFEKTGGKAIWMVA